MGADRGRCETPETLQNSACFARRTQLHVLEPAHSERALKVHVQQLRLH